MSRAAASTEMTLVTSHHIYVKLSSYIYVKIAQYNPMKAHLVAWEPPPTAAYDSSSTTATNYFK